MNTPRPRRPPFGTGRRGWREASFLALDFETTGLDVSDRIVSFGVVPVNRGAIDLGGARHGLVDPGERTPSRVSVTIHGLRPVDLAAEGMSLERAIADLARLADGRFLLAWFARVETRFLAAMSGMSERRWRARTLDVRDLFVALEGSGAQHVSLSAAAMACGVPVADPHHALDDALVTAQLFLVLAARWEAGGHGARVADLLRLPRLA